jgi:hypothetical protein
VPLTHFPREGALALVTNDADSLSLLAGSVDALRAGRTYIDPMDELSREISHQKSRLLHVRKTSAELQAFFVKQRVGEHPGYEAIGPLRGMLSNPEVKTLVDSPINVRELHLKMIDGRRARHLGT